MKTKICINPKCHLLGVHQPVTNFFPEYRNNGRYQSWCKPCHRIRAKERRERDKANKLLAQQAMPLTLSDVQLELDMRKIDLIRQMARIKKHKRSRTMLLQEETLQYRSLL